jgi:formate hydrogenlyase transcriptional activator
VRELENLVHRALVFSGEAELELPEGWDETGDADSKAADPSTEVPESFDDAVRRILTSALEASEGRIHGPTGAAARLGLRPTTLQAKLQKLGLRRGR